MPAWKSVDGSAAGDDLHLQQQQDKGASQLVSRLVRFGWTSKVVKIERSWCNRWNDSWCDDNGWPDNDSSKGAEADRLEALIRRLEALESDHKALVIRFESLAVHKAETLSENIPEVQEHRSSVKTLRWMRLPRRLPAGLEQQHDALRVEVSSRERLRQHGAERGFGGQTLGSGAGALRFAEAEQAQLHGRRVEAKHQLLSLDTELRRGLDERECRAQELAQAKRAAQKEEHAEAMALQSELTREKRAADERAGEVAWATSRVESARAGAKSEISAPEEARKAKLSTKLRWIPVRSNDGRSMRDEKAAAAAEGARAPEEARKATDEGTRAPDKAHAKSAAAVTAATEELRALQARAAGPLTQAKNKAEARCADAREAAAQARIKAEAEIAPLCHSEEAEAMVLQRTEETEAKLVQSLSAARTDVADAEADANSALGEGAVVSGQEDRAKGAAPQSSVVAQVVQRAQAQSLAL